jgi:hypothetical protein
MCLSQPFRKAKTRFRQVTPSPGIAAAEAGSPEDTTRLRRPTKHPAKPSGDFLAASWNDWPPTGDRIHIISSSAGGAVGSSRRQRTRPPP